MNGVRGVVMVIKGKIDAFGKVVSEQGVGAAVVGAAKNVAAAVLPETTQSKARVALCNLCPFDGLNRRTRVCKFCSCEVDKKAKYPGEHCPKSLW